MVIAAIVIVIISRGIPSKPMIPRIKNAARKFGTTPMKESKTFLNKTKNIAKIPVLADIVASVGLPGENVDEVIKAGTFKERVDRDWAIAEELNILVLPTFVVNGDRLAGAQPYHKLQRLIEKSGVVTKKG